jgi:hypothetical protein
VEVATATDQFVAAARIRFGPLQPRHTPLLLIRAQFGLAESLINVSQRAGDDLLKGRSMSGAFLSVHDAAGIAQAVGGALPVLGAAEMIRKYAREWSQEQPAGEAADPGEALADVEHWLAREEQLRQRFFRFVGEVDAATIPARLPSARAQLDVCRAAIGRLTPRTKWLGDALRRTLSGHSEISPEQRRELGQAFKEQNSGIEAEVEVIASAHWTVYGELAPLSARTLKVRRLSYSSPLEMTVALSGAAAGIVAVLNQILEFRANYKARNDTDQAIRAALEKQIAEDELARDVCIKLRKQLDNKILGDLKITEVEVLDDPAEDWDWPTDDE